MSEKYEKEKAVIDSLGKNLQQTNNPTSIGSTVKDKSFKIVAKGIQDDDYLFKWKNFHIVEQNGQNNSLVCVAYSEKSPTKQEQDPALMVFGAVNGEIVYLKEGELDPGLRAKWVPKAKTAITPK